MTRIRWRRGALAAALVTLAAVALHWASGHTPMEIVQAERACDARDFESADVAIANLLEKDPEDSRARAWCVRIARRRMDYREAKEQLEACDQMRIRSAELDLESRLYNAQLGDLRRLEVLAHEYSGSVAPEAALVMEAVAIGSLQILSPNPGTSSIRGPEQEPIIAMGLEAVERWLALRSSPQDRSAGLVWRGRLRDIQADHAAAIADLNAACRLDPASFDARLHLALSSRSESEPRATLNELLSLRDRRPKDLFLQRMIASGYRRVGQLEEADKLLNALIELHPDDPNLRFERGLLAIDRDRPHEAEVDLDWVRGRRPDVPEVYMALSRCMTQLGRVEQSKAYLDRFLELDAARLAPRPGG